MVPILTFSSLQTAIHSVPEKETPQVTGWVLKAAQVAEQIFFLSRQEHRIGHQIYHLLSKIALHPVSRDRLEHLFYKKLKEVDAVYDYVHKNGPTLTQVTQAYNTSLYLKPEITQLARPIQIRPDGSAFVHLTRSRKQGKDLFLGAGGNKIVKYAVCLKTQKLYASASFVQGLFHEELDCLKMFKGYIDFVQYLDAFTYLKDGKLKTRVLFEYYPDVTLDFQMRITPFTKEDQKRIFEQLICAVTFLHDCDYFHRDLKPKNIFMRRDEHQKLWPVLADFGSACRREDSAAKNEIATSVEFSSPELLEADTPEKRIAATDSLDAWSLGLTLYELLKMGPDTWWNYRLPPRLTAQLGKDLREKLKKKGYPPTAPEGLVADLLLGKITFMDALQRLPKLNWELPTKS